MSQEVTISSVTANTPVDIYYCDSMSASCVYVATVATFPYTFDVLDPYDNGDFVIKIVDTQSCEIGQIIEVTPTPTPTTTVTPTPTTSVTPTQTSNQPDCLIVVDAVNYVPTVSNSVTIKYAGSSGFPPIDSGYGTAQQACEEGPSSSFSKVLYYSGVLGNGVKLYENSDLTGSPYVFDGFFNLDWIWGDGHSFKLPGEITNYELCLPTTTIIDIGTNDSLDIAIDLSNMTVNGVTVTDVIGTDPNTTGNGASVRTTQIGTYDIVLTYDSTEDGQKITLIDSDGTPYCNNTTGGGSMTFYDVVIDGVNIVTITAFDGVCV